LENRGVIDQGNGIVVFSKFLMRGCLVMKLIWVSPLISEMDMLSIELSPGAGSDGEVLGETAIGAFGS
jgi:hypothetical protein